MVTALDAITKQRTSFLELGFERCPIRVGADTSFRHLAEYFVIPADWNQLPPGLPKNFAMRMTPTHQELASHDLVDCTLFAVSSDIPPEFRSLVALHEAHEFAAMPLAAGPRFIVESTDTVPGGCMAASVVEFMQLLTCREYDKAQIAAYVAMRSKFFTDLVGFCRNSDPYSPDLIANFQESERFWKQYRKMLG